jgi:antitoxin VapB
MEPFLPFHGIYSTVGLNIKNPEVESLAAEVARRLGTSKTEAIKVALRRQLDESDQGVATEVKLARMRKFLEERIWPHVDAKYLGKGISQEEQDEILGYGPDGV